MCEQAACAVYGCKNAIDDASRLLAVEEAHMGLKAISSIPGYILGYIYMIYIYPVIYIHRI